MKIRFLKVCEAPQRRVETICDCCGPQPTDYEPTWFESGEEAEPDRTWHEIDLSGLKYKVDFEIVEYP